MICNKCGKKLSEGKHRNENELCTEDICCDCGYHEVLDS